MYIFTPYIGRSLYIGKHHTRVKKVQANELVHEILLPIAYRNCNGSVKPTQTYSLARAFTAKLLILDFS